ncbi:MAG: hypothetical protein V3V68_04865 [Nitrosomonadaceae bacterium]
MDLESLSKTVEYMKGKVDMIVAALIGDPTDESKPGLLIRLDRLERAYRVLVWFGGALVTVVATIIAAFVIKLI